MVVFCGFNHQSADFLTELFCDFFSAQTVGVNGLADDNTQIFASEFIIARNAEGNYFCARSLGKEACAGLEAKQEFFRFVSDLYDPLAMPPVLMKAHQALDKAVDAAYRSTPFTSDSQRMEFLFELYNKYNSQLFDTKKKK